MHMLTKPQVSYDDTHKQALGYQNPFYLKKAQRIKPTLYDDSVISNQYAVIHVIDDEETLILEESDEQAFWLQTSHPNTDQSDISPVKIEAPKVILVSTNLKKLKYHLGQFDTVVKKQIIPDAIIEGEWGFEHTKAVFLNEIIPFLKTLKDIFNVFDKDILNESMENADLKGQIQEKVFVTTTLQNELKRLKGKNMLDNATTITNTTTIAPGMFKLDLDPLAPRLLKNRDAHIDYLKHTQEQAYILQGIVKQAKAKQPLDNALDFVESSKTPDSNTPVLPSTGLKSSTSASISQPTSNKKNDRISQTPSSNIKNKVEVQLRRANLSSNKKNSVKDPICDVKVKHTMLNGNSKLICVKCKQCMFDANHDVCFLDFVNDVNVRSKSKSTKQSKQHNIWKPTGKVFTEVGYKWKPTGKFFTLVGNTCPLTRFTSANLVPPKETTSHSVETQKPDIKVYSRRPKQVKTMFHLLLLLSMTGCPDCSLIAKIMGYSDYQLGNITISRVYYVEGLKHNLFLVGQFCDSDLEVAFWKNTCFIWNLEGVDLLLGSKDTNLYTISLDDMLKTSPIYLLSKALKTKSWLWHHWLSHLNFGTLNKLAKDGLARGIPKLKFKKDHLCSTCALGKSKKSSHQPKAEDTNQEKLYLLHMDVKILRSKDEALDAIIKCIKNIQVRLNATVRNVRTDNGTEFVNQTLHEFYENVSISHQTSVARTP
ncbi:retrovirus-related pol polyprotein from transposon TNT 1-94 [Tanacetum coccineum]